MQQFTFNVGVQFHLDGQLHGIARILDEDRLLVEREDGTSYFDTKDALLKLYVDRRLVFIERHKTAATQEISSMRALCTFPEKVQAEAIRRKKYLDFVEQYGSIPSTPSVLTPLISLCAEQINDPKPPSSITVYRWRRQLISARRESRSLISKHHLRGTAGSRLNPEVQVLVQEAIEQVYLTEQRNSIEEAFSHLAHLVAAANRLREMKNRLSLPSRSTFTRAVRSLDKYETTVSRHGLANANMRFRTTGKGPQANRILERVEIDHTPLDLFVICDKTHLPMGRPTLTVAIDKFSRMVLGVHIGFDGPSIEAVFACLRHAILPKADLKSDHPDIDNTWPCYGAITELVCDNGLEFHSLELERLAFETGMTLTFCPRRAPYYKGAIERFLKTINYKFAHGMPGTSFARWFHREDYDSQAQAVIPLSTLRSILYRWIVDVYAQTLHRGIATTPYKKWMRGVESFAPTLPVSPQRLDIALGRTVERTLSHAGVELHNLRYNSDELLRVRRQMGPTARVEVRYYSGDISYVHVIDPITKEAIPVPALDGDYAEHLSLQQHRMICMHVRKVENESVNIASITKAKAEIRQIVFDLQNSKRQRERQRGHQIGIPSLPRQVDVEPTSESSGIENLLVSAASVKALGRLKTSSVLTSNMPLGEKK
jgi:putative transposase